MQGRHVGVPEHDLRVRPHQGPVEPGQEVDGAGPAARARDRPDGVVFEERVELVEPAGREAGREAGPVEDAVRHPDGEAERGELGDAALEPLLVHRAGGGRDGHQVAGAQGAGLHEVRP